MRSVLEKQENLLAQKGTILWDGYVNMLKTLESVFLSPKHWILEFLQNAEDANATKISICLEQDSLHILNDGDKFTETDFDTICDVYSRKLPSLGFRGYIGIGFKSIFRLTNRIDVHSGNYHFRFDKTFWDNSKRGGISISKWPWEILPIETDIIELPGNYTTLFHVPLKHQKGQEMLKAVNEFLTSPDFPKEAVLLLEKIKVIEVRTPELSFVITKEVIDSETLSIGKKEIVLVKKYVTDIQCSEEDYYLVFKKLVKVPDNIKEDEETERVRRSDINEREIGLVFGLDSEKDIKSLTGKLSGVYSFLPVEGEETGLNFGVFGDFIPQIGRDLINYEAKWNRWMCGELFEFFKQIVQNVFLPSPKWRFFPSEIHNYLKISDKKKFWGDVIQNPIRDFLNSENLYPDYESELRGLKELVDVNEDIIQIFGKENLEKVLNKKIVNPKIKEKVSSDIKSIGIYEILQYPEALKTLNNQPEKLVDLYRAIENLSDYYINGRRGSDKPLSKVAFVLAEDNTFQSPNETVVLDIDENYAPEFLKVIIPITKKFLHPEIKKDSKATDQLRRCGLETINTQNIISKLKQIINGIKTPEMCPDKWKYPDDIIKATLFLISQNNGELVHLVAEDGTFQEPSNMFMPGGSLEWNSLWEAQLLPGIQPIHKKYFNKEWLVQYKLKVEDIHQYLNNLGVHGFDREKDKSLIQNAAYAIAKKRLNYEGHKLADVTERNKLGYDLQCQVHCEKVFEVKGMGEPKDVSLEESEFTAAQQKKDNYILVCVYNLPSYPDKIGYKSIPNPERICQPVEKAKIPKEKWLSI